jgi:hypothetical protein
MHRIIQPAPLYGNNFSWRFKVRKIQRHLPFRAGQRSERIFLRTALYIRLALHSSIYQDLLVPKTRHEDATAEPAWRSSQPSFHSNASRCLAPKYRRQARLCNLIETAMLTIESNKRHQTVCIKQSAESEN